MEVRLALAVYGALEYVGFATFGGAKESVKKEVVCCLHSAAVVCHFR